MIIIHSIQFSQRLQVLKRLRLTIAHGFVVLLITAFIPVGVHAQQGAADRQRLDQFQQSLDSLRRQYGIPGLSAAIVSNGRIIWEKGFGFQDVENQIPATPDTPIEPHPSPKHLLRCY